jgi:hypothetical protein
VFDTEDHPLEVKNVVHTSSDEAWINGIRKAAKSPEAKVVLFRERTWEAPILPSFDAEDIKDSESEILQAIQKVFVSHGLPKISQEEFTRNMGWIKNPEETLLVIVVKHIDQPTEKNSRKQWWQFWK